jgi:DNA polymerase
LKEGRPLLLVLEAPDSEEDLVREHLAGRAGQLVAKLLGQAGITPSDYYITHMVKCHSKSKGSPPDEAVDACKVWVWKEIMAVKPKAMLTFGEKTSQKLLHMKPSEHYGPFVGDLHPTYLPPLKDVQVMPMWSPVYLLRQGQKFHDGVVKSLVKLKDFCIQG